jgi:hypothetical protein
MSAQIDEAIKTAENLVKELKQLKCSHPQWSAVTGKCTSCGKSI